MKTQIPVLKIENKWSSGRNEVHEIAPILNIICERLWMRDQDYIQKNGITRDTSNVTTVKKKITR